MPAIQSGPKASAMRASTSSTLDVSASVRSEEHTSELQSQSNLVCRLLLEKKKKEPKHHATADACEPQARTTIAVTVRPRSRTRTLRHSRFHGFFVQRDTVRPENLSIPYRS